ncbi:hypothetical protein MRX96_038691 [Rhipicephalus microplus]
MVQARHRLAQTLLTSMQCNCAWEPPLIPTLVKPDGWPTLVCLCKVHSGTLRQHMPSLRPAVIGTLQSRTASSNLKRTGSGSR